MKSKNTEVIICVNLTNFNELTVTLDNLRKCKALNVNKSLLKAG